MPALLKLKTEAEKATRTVMDTMLVTPEIVKKWKAPPFQRPVKENHKVVALAEKLKTDGGVWPGVVTLGVFEKETYIIDGQHRRAAFLIAGIAEGYCDVRIHYVDSLAQMGEEFVRLNSALVKMGPDDILRGLEAALPALQMIRQLCPYVGYDQIRRGDTQPVLSMATAIRCWRGASHATPATTGTSSHDVATTMLQEEAAMLCEFLHIAHNAWGRDPQYFRMWSQLNLCMCMWLYQQLVAGRGQGGVKRATRFTKELFQKCLMALTTDAVYLDWLIGRHLTERERAPAYTRIKTIFHRRAIQELGDKVLLPSPEWCTR